MYWFAWVSLLQFASRLTYYVDIMGMANEFLEAATYTGMKFSVNGDMRSFMDPRIRLAFLLVSSLISIPSFPILRYRDRSSQRYRYEIRKEVFPSFLTRLPRFSVLSLLLTFYSIQVMYANALGAFEYDPKFSDFRSDWIWVGFSMLITYLALKMVHVWFIRSKPMFILLVITGVFMSSGSFKVALLVYLPLFTLWLITASYRLAPDRERLVVLRKG